MGAETLPPPPVTLLDALQYARLIASVCERRLLTSAAGSDRAAEALEALEQANRMAETLASMARREAPAV